ncbi:MAG: type II secretion system F family protein [Actinobacteria bacterium]|nr:type II secretion system F family protein [Actinomycetota bacterium]
MTLFVAVAAGLLVGAGTVAAVWGIRPPLAPLDQRVEAVLSGRYAAHRSGPWRRWRDKLVARTPTAVLPDLALLGRTPAEFVTGRLAWAAGGLVAVVLLAGLLGVPLQMLPLFAAAGTVAGWYLGLHELRDAAAKRRRTMALAIAAWTQMAAMMIRAGLGVEQAMRQAATAGTHWTFRMLHSSLVRAVEDRRPTWHTLAALGDETDVSELRQLAAELRLIDTVGGSPTEALLTRAQTLREQELADQLAAIKAAEVKQAVPLALLGICLTAFVVYPAVQSFLSP